jgi:hypothetical protein
MSKTFVYDRFDCTNGGSQHCYGCYGMDPCSDGDYVKAEDAINREAVLQAQIRTLETQLKDARALYGSASKYEPSYK